MIKKENNSTVIVLNDTFLLKLSLKDRSNFEDKKYYFKVFKRLVIHTSQYSWFAAVELQIHYVTYLFMPILLIGSEP